MRSGPAYRTVERSVGIDIVSLNAFGGDFDDPVAAWIRVGNDVVVQVVAPDRRATWGEAIEEQFKTAVRDLAATYPFHERRGQVSVLFDPPDPSETGPFPEGEIIGTRG